MKQIIVTEENMIDLIQMIAIGFNNGYNEKEIVKMLFESEEFIKMFS